MIDIAMATIIFNFFFLFTPFYYNIEIVAEVLLVQGSLLEKK